MTATAAMPRNLRGVSRVRAVHRVHRLHQLLVRQYGEPKPHRRLPALDQLVCTILSQNTTDTNSLEAFRRLKAKFPAWSQAAAAPVRGLAAPIRIGGLAQVKARCIKDLLTQLQEREGRLTLEFLARRPPAEALAYLREFRGVGAKTAACTLLFSFQMPVLPVDTHIHRVAIRLALIGESADRDEAHDLLGAIVPAPLVYPFHLLMIEHGRRTCHARKPDCAGCCLRRMCPAAAGFLADAIVQRA